MWMAIIAFAAYRLWQAFAGSPIGWNDSLDYAHSAVWAGSRPPLVPAVLGLAGSATTFVALQVTVGIAAWVTLALVACRSHPPRWRFTTLVVVLGFASTTAVVRWDRSVLSESLAMSALALLLAALLVASDGPLSWWKVGALIGAGALFASVKDVHVWVVWLVAIFVAIVSVVRQLGARGIVAALGLALCAGVFLGGSLSAHRADDPIAHAYFVRVFPYADRVSWFAAHGMPDSDIVRTYARDTVTPRGEAPVVVIDRERCAACSPSSVGSDTTVSACTHSGSSFIRGPPSPSRSVTPSGHSTSPMATSACTRRPGARSSTSSTQPCSRTPWSWR